MTRISSPFTVMKNANATSPAHTPAPFGVFESPAGQLYIAQLGTRGAQHKHLCVLTLDDVPVENAANARLFAAAPDLLGHLQRIVALSHAVAANWERGDLARAVRDLEHAATAAEGTLARAEGAPGC